MFAMASYTLKYTELQFNLEALRGTIQLLEMAAGEKYYIISRIIWEDNFWDISKAVFKQMPYFNGSYLDSDHAAFKSW